MTQQHWKHIKTVFAAAVEIKSAARRNAYVTKECRGSPSLQAQIESLLLNCNMSSPFWSEQTLRRGTRLLHYELIERVSEGSAGIVYKAHDTRLQRVVALKILAPLLAMDAIARARFLGEAQCASALSHPNIVTIHDINHDKGICFIVMEYVSGKGLHRVIPKHGIPLRRCLALAIQIADALAKAHAAGIIHRDLKPGNVLLNAEGRIKVVDFGLAKNTGSGIQSPIERTHRGTVLGTAGYMSPEQVRGRRADARSDIFSFGAVFYEMLIGRPAFQRESLLATMKAIESENPRMPRRIPKCVLRLLKRCLKKNPSARFREARDLVQALTAASGGA